MKQTAIFPGKYVQSEAAIESLAEEIQPLGDKALIIADGTAEAVLVPRCLPAWRERLAVTVERFGGESSDEEIERLTKVAREHGCNVIIGMGGGKVIDTAKAVAHAAAAPVAVVPTIASTDAPTSAVAAICTRDGAFSRYLFLPRNPDLVLVDTRVIAEAPVRYLVAGMGDALATWFEAEPCRLAFAPNQCGGLGTLAGYAVARLCYDTVLEYGLAARTACQQEAVTPALAHIVEANTLLSGLGFESGGLAAAHSIHNGLTRLDATHSYLHGEKVAIGVLAGLFLTDKPMSIVREVYGFCELVGLPTTLKDIGLGEASDNELRHGFRGGVRRGRDDPPEPRPVSPDAVFAALKAADRFGCDRLNQDHRSS